MALNMEQIAKENMEFAKLSKEEKGTAFSMKLTEVLPEEGYFLMGIHDKTFTFTRGATDFSDPRKASKVTDRGEKSFEELSDAQKGLFSNLDNPKFPEKFQEYSQLPLVLENYVDEGIHMLLMVKNYKNRLGHTVVTKSGVIFRDLTQEELEEKRKREELKVAIKMGVNPNPENKQNSGVISFF